VIDKKYRRGREWLLKHDAGRHVASAGRETDENLGGQGAAALEPKTMKLQSWFQEFRGCQQPPVPLTETVPFVIKDVPSD
jgi:hypothetical protein